MILKKRKRNSDALYGACLMKINERNYKEKRCVTCDSWFKPIYPAKICCCDECRDIHNQKKKEKYYKINHKQIKAKQKEGMMLKTCEICGEFLDNNHQYVHEKCMLDKYLNNYSCLRNKTKYYNFMRNHFATTKLKELMNIAKEEFGLNIDLQSNRIQRNGLKSVICLETGERFNSVKEATQAKYVSTSSIYNAINNNKTSVGYHWKYV